MLEVPLKNGSVLFRVPPGSPVTKCACFSTCGRYLWGKAFGVRTPEGEKINMGCALRREITTDEELRRANAELAEKIPEEERVVLGKVKKKKLPKKKLPKKIPEEERVVLGKVKKKKLPKKKLPKKVPEEGRAVLEEVKKKKLPKKKMKLGEFLRKGDGLAADALLNAPESVRRKLLGKKT